MMDLVPLVRSKTSSLTLRWSIHMYGGLNEVWGTDPIRTNNEYIKEYGTFEYVLEAVQDFDLWIMWRVGFRYYESF